MSLVWSEWQVCVKQRCVFRYSKESGPSISLWFTSIYCSNSNQL